MDINGFNKNSPSTKAGSSPASTTTTAPARTPGQVQNDIVRQQVATPRQDTVMISAEAGNIVRLHKQMDPTPPMNREKIESIKAAIARGDYHVDARKVAEKMLAGDDLFAEA